MSNDSITTTTTTMGRREGHVPPTAREPPATASTRLLDKFTSQWEHLHRASEMNIAKSKLALNKLTSLDHTCRTRLDAMNHFVSSYKSLSELEQQIENISSDLESLASSFAKIEECLSVLAERNERTSCEAFIRNYTGNHEARVQSDKIRTELKRDQLMTEHLQRVQAFERHQQRALDERRKVLASEFEAEKSRYMDKSREESGNRGQ